MRPDIPVDRPAWLRTFTRYRPKRLRRRSIAVWDIETADGTLLGPPAGIAFTSDRDFCTPLEQVKQFGGPACMTDFLSFYLQKRYRGYVAYAHKGLSFDLSHLFANAAVQQWILDAGFRAEVNSSFAIIRRGSHAWYFADSLRLIPEKLAKLLPTFAPAYTKTPLPTSPFSWDDPAWRARITVDTKGLYVALCKLEEVMLETFSVPLSLTMPATSLKAARRMLPVASVPRPPRPALDWIRAGCYSGGRIETYWQGPVTGSINVLDINSAYAWAMKQPLPVGAGRYTRTEQQTGYQVSRCRVVVPTMLIPPVLSRLYHHAFPVGSFQAILTPEEVALARSVGATVDVVEGWHWKRTAPMFQTFVEKCEKLRRTDYSGPLGKTVKLAQNGLYGILGMNPFRREYLLTLENPGPPWTPAFDLDTGTYPPHVWEATCYRESPSQMAHWAAIITARVRVRLTEYLYKCERAGLLPLYAHTDSVWTVGANGLPESVQQLVSDEYGSLKLERMGNEAIIVGPGEAALHSPDNGSTPDGGQADPWHIVSKGWAAIPDDFLRGRAHQVEQTQVFRAGTALKRGSPGRTIHKTIGNFAAMRNRIPPARRPGLTLPKTAEAYSYDYFSYQRWYVGKLLDHPPLRSKARLDPATGLPAGRHGVLVGRTVSLSTRAKLSAAGSRRADREFVEGYEAYLRATAEGVPAALIHELTGERRSKRRKKPGKL